jgi:hypothetical protein
LWFEAMVEILYQAGSDGLPGLFELLEPDAKTHYALIVVRLLRLAAGNVQKKAILAKVQARLPEMGHGEGPESVQEVMLWAERGDPRLAKLLRTMAKVKLKGIGEETVGSVMKEWAESRAIYL